MLFIIPFDLLKFDCSFRFLNVDKFCFTAPLKLSTTCFREGLLEIKGAGVGGWGEFLMHDFFFKSPLVCRNFFLGDILM